MNENTGKIIIPNSQTNVQYPAKGHPETAQEIERLLSQNDVPFESETKRGLDHGAWVVLRMLYPNADIPVISMSVNPDLAPDHLYKIGKALSELRSKDVLIIGSGGTVHNLRAVNMSQNEGEPDDWAREFDDWLSDHLHRWDLDSLFAYESLAPHAPMAVPPHGKEHFIPLFYAMGAADNVRKANLLHRNYRYGNLSHSVWQFG